MNNTIRSGIRNHTPNLPFQSPPKHLGEKASAVRFRPITTMASKPENQQSKDNANGKSGDEMSHSFGEGYATRSDEEGFGGTIGGKEPGRKIQIDREIHEDHPAYDKSQRSEVKEKEKARHQTNAES